MIGLPLADLTLSQTHDRAQSTKSVPGILINNYKFKIKKSFIIRCSVVREREKLGENHATNLLLQVAIYVLKTKQTKNTTTSSPPLTVKANDRAQSKTCLSVPGAIPVLRTLLQRTHPSISV